MALTRDQKAQIKDWLEEGYTKEVVEFYANNSKLRGPIEAHLEKLFEDNKDLLDVVNNYRRSLLHYAAIENFESLLKLLLRNGGCFDDEDNAGDSPLHLAAKHDAAHAITVLMDEETRSDHDGLPETLHRNKAGQTPKDCAEGATLALLQQKEKEFWASRLPKEVKKKDGAKKGDKAGAAAAGAGVRFPLSGGAILAPDLVPRWQDTVCRPALLPLTRPVAYVETKGVGQGTGALVGGRYFLTAGHCVLAEPDNPASLAKAEDISLYFEYANPSCGGGVKARSIEDHHRLYPGVIDAFAVKRVCDAVWDALYDYAILEVAPQSASSNLTDYGCVRLAASPGIKVAEEVIVIHHPGGHPKKISEGKLTSISIKKEGATTAFFANYDLDTEGGSSGGPALRASDRALIGVHVLGSAVGNSALTIQSIMQRSALMTDIVRTYGVA